MYREELFDKLIEGVERTDGRMVLMEGWYNEPIIFYPFPEALFTDENEKKAALLFMMCEEASAYLHKFILLMLNGKSPCHPFVASIS